MADGKEIFIFNKTLDERFEECRSVLYWEPRVIPAKNVRAEWTCHVEMKVDPFDWRAVWKMPMQTCGEYDALFPTIVIVRVDSVDFVNLKASVSIISVQDESISLPASHNVNLIDLWPTKEQFNAATNADCIAECIDALRFFYTRIWWPWDDDDDSDTDWYKTHLENRFQLLHDIEDGKLSPQEVYMIQFQLYHARFIRDELNYLDKVTMEMELSEKEAAIANDRNTCLRHNYDLSVYSKEFEFIENPTMRHIYFEKHFYETNQPILSTSYEQTNFLVLQPQKIDICWKMLRRVKVQTDEDDLIDIRPSLQDALDMCNKDSKVFVAPEFFSIRLMHDIGNILIFGIILEEAFDLKQAEEEQTIPVIGPLRSDYALFHGIGTLILKNLKLDCEVLRTGIVFKKGKLEMENCLMVGNDRSSITEAIHGNEGAEIVLKNCHIESFAQAIVAGMAVGVELNNVEFTECRIGLVIEAAHTKVEIHNTMFNKCTKMAIKVDMTVDCKPPNNQEFSVEVDTVNDVKKYLQDGLAWNGDAEFRECPVKIGIYNCMKSVVSNNDRDQMT